LVVSIVSHLPEIIAGLIAAIPSIISSIVSAFGPLGEALGGVFGGVLEVCGGILGELGTIAEGVFTWIGTLMDDPAQAIKDAFDGILGYAQKTFESVKTIITGIFEGISEAKEAKERDEYAKGKRNEMLEFGNEKGLRLREENGVSGWEVADEAKYLAYYGGRDALGLLEKSDNTLHVDGEVTINGVNSEGEFIETAQYVYNHLGGELRKEVRR
jgi:hypothetical protein